MASDPARLDPSRSRLLASSRARLDDDSRSRVLASRRSLLVAGGVGLAALVAGPRGRARQARAFPFGPLVPDPDGIMDLPAGFSYRVLETFGDPMDDGYTVPHFPDGMATFPGPDGTVILMRNHELLIGDGPYALGMQPPEAFDPLAMGCVTRVVLDGATFERISSNLVLCGTLINCAGGWSPWGWLSCEENTSPGHGYVFLCDPAAASVQPPQQIAAYGRFKHEAAAIDPATHVAYLTEDQDDSSFYRFVPDDPAEPFVGRLQALVVRDQPRLATTAMTPGERLPIEWVDLAEPDPSGDTVRVEAQGKGAAIFDRGEGITFDHGDIYIVSTSGGPIGKGQIFRLVDDPVEPFLELLVHAVDPAVMKGPDNITMAPWGELLFAEDNVDTNYIRGITQDGAIFDFARCVLSTSELSGVCFSPDGKALFINIYRQGLTLVITGPFPDAPPPEETTGAAESESEAGTDGSATTGESSGAGEASTDAATTGPGLDDDASGCGCRSDADGGEVASEIAAAIAAAAVLAGERARPR